MAKNRKQVQQPPLKTLAAEQGHEQATGMRKPQKLIELRQHCELGALDHRSQNPFGRCEEIFLHGRKRSLNV